MGTKMREEKLSEMIEEKVKEATEVCEAEEMSEECRVAWDEVEEVSQARADLRIKLKLLNQDPLESFCQENPETDECRIYED
ncbi:Calvin cycle protein CP12-3 [Arabidopsis thaliana]